MNAREKLSGDGFGSEFGRKDCGPLDSEQIDLILTALKDHLIPDGCVAVCKVCDRKADECEECYRRDYPRENDLCPLRAKE